MNDTCVSTFVSFCLFEHVFQNDFGVMISWVSDGFFPILNRFLWTPLEAGQTLFTAMKPRWLFIGRLDIVGRTDF
jgi:hypothetical protein